MIDPRRNDDPSLVRSTFADGNMTPVERIGDAVVRQSLANASGVHAVLRYLQRVGYVPAPRYLGSDVSHEWLTYLPGATVPSALEGFEDDAFVSILGHEVSRLHTALAAFDTSSVASWHIMPGTPPATTLCHNDLAPWNTVFDNGTFGGFIDWDLVSPGPPVWDLAWVAWWWGPMYESERFGAPCNQGRRVRLLLDAYGLDASERVGFVDVLRRRMQCGFDTVVEWGQAGMPGFEKLYREGHHLGTPSNISWLDANADELRECIEQDGTPDLPAAPTDGTGAAL